MERDRFYQGMFWGTLIGASFGAVLGVIFAPKKGEETRLELAERLGELLGVPLPLSSAMPPNSIPPKDGAEPPEQLENTAKMRSEAVVKTVKTEAQHLLDDAESILREIKTQSQRNN